MMDEKAWMGLQCYPRMTYPEALSFLGDARWFGMKLGLENMRALAHALGEPQKGLRFIHLAGTNGKGSTAAFCESVLREAGFRVGLYTSPHLISIRERIQIDRVPISGDDFAEGMTAVRQAMESIEGGQATFFELVTALALWKFARENVDWVVWETGLGGRLDATNIVTPEVCIITSIGLEHQQYLGETLKEIAGEKAGIIKSGVLVISAVANGVAGDIIEETAPARGCELTRIHRDLAIQDLGLVGHRQLAKIGTTEFELGLLGAHQIENAACAVGAVRHLQIGELAISRGLATASWPGRFEVLSDSPLMVLDGAHNPSGMKRLVETWRAYLESFEPSGNLAHLVFGSVADKPVHEMAEILRPYIKKVSLVRLANERTAQPADLAASFAGLPCTCHESVAALRESLQDAAPGEPVLITGSLFLVGEMLAAGQAYGGEYQLNERLEKASPTR